MDAIENFAYGIAASGSAIGSTSGTSLVLQSGQGALFPAAPFNLLMWPAAQSPTHANAEIARCTAISTDTLTLTRNVGPGGGAQAVAVGWQCCQSVDAGLIEQLIALSVTRAFPFTYSLSGLATGAAIGYAPTVGEVIRGWFSIGTAWNGITPSGDFGQFQGTGLGVLALGQPAGPGVAVMSAPDVSADGSTLVSGHGAGLLTPAGGVGGPGVMSQPLIAATTDPIFIVVSQDGNALTATASVTAPVAPAFVSGSLTITTGVNDQFQFGPPSALVTYTVPGGSYTLSTLATALTTLLGPSGADLVNVTAPGSVLVATAVSAGAWGNDNEFQEGNGFLAASGFAAGVGLSGGTGGSPGSTAGSGTFYLASALPTSI